MNIQIYTYKYKYKLIQKDHPSRRRLAVAEQRSDRLHNYMVFHQRCVSLSGIAIDGPSAAHPADSGHEAAQEHDGIMGPQYERGFCNHRSSGRSR